MAWKKGSFWCGDGRGVPAYVCSADHYQQHRKKALSSSSRSRSHRAINHNKNFNWKILIYIFGKFHQLDKFSGKRFFIASFFFSPAFGHPLAESGERRGFTTLRIRRREGLSQHDKPSIDAKAVHFASAHCPKRNTQKGRERERVKGTYNQINWELWTGRVSDNNWIGFDEDEHSSAGWSCPFGTRFFPALRFHSSSMQMGGNVRFTSPVMQSIGIGTLNGCNPSISENRLVAIDFRCSESRRGAHERIYLLRPLSATDAATNWWCSAMMINSCSSRKIIHTLKIFVK